MPTPITAQNFDAVTAPALPAGWTYDTGYDTSTTVFTSSPNSLRATGTTAQISAYFNTQDANSGNAQMSATVSFTSSTNGIRVLCRGTVAPVGAAGTYYFASVKGNTGLRLLRCVAGVTAQIGSTIGSSSTFTASAQYIVQIATIGSAQIAAVQRVSDGFWLNNVGVWQLGVTAAITGADTLIPPTVGYGGVSTQNSATTDKTYFDNLVFENLTGSGIATGAGTLTVSAAGLSSSAGAGVATGAGTLSPGVALSSSSGIGVATGAGTLTTAVSLSSSAGIGVATGTAALNPGSTGLSSSAGTGIATGAGTLRTAVPVASATGVGVATGAGTLSPGVALSSSSGIGVATGAGTLSPTVSLSSSAGAGIATGTATLNPVVALASSSGTGVATGTAALNPGGTGLSSSAGVGVATGTGTLKTAVPVASSSGTGIATGAGTLSPTVSLSSSAGIGVATGTAVLNPGGTGLSSGAGIGIATGTGTLAVSGAGGCQTIFGSPSGFTLGVNIPQSVTFAIPVGTWGTATWQIAGASGSGVTTAELTTTGASHTQQFTSHTGAVSNESVVASVAQLADINAAAGGTLTATLQASVAETITGFTLVICPAATGVPLASAAGTGVATGAGTLATTVPLSGSATGVATGAASFPAPPATGGILAAVADENIVLFASVSMGLSAIVDDSYVGTGSQGSGIN